MCGIAGLIMARPKGVHALREVVGGMTALLGHRGPDGDGLWIDGTNDIGLGHRRLAIVDLSPTGQQPMVSESGRYVVVFNGEIYNHRTVRQQLERRGAAFRGSSDTEVLLAGVEAWGLETTLQKCTGMFAIALWDRRERCLRLARDRVGEKPLYVWRNTRGLAFASELRPVLLANEFDFNVDRRVLGLFLRYGYVPDPMCIVEGAHKVRPGTIEEWSLCAAGIAVDPKTVRYWSLDESRVQVPTDPVVAVDLLEAELRRVVEDQRVADVSVGAFLSGGIDSTAVTSVMQSLSMKPVRTFCVSFENPAYDEGPHARRVAEHLGTDHTEVRIDAVELIKIVADLPAIYDEPFADSSQIPSIAVARIAQQHVKVSLSGDGGDETFGGYNRYYWPNRIARWTGAWPVGLRELAAGALTAAARRTPSRVLKGLHATFTGGRGPIQDFRGKLGKAASILVQPDPIRVYMDLMTRWRDLSTIVPGWDFEDPGEIRLRQLMSQSDPFSAATRWDFEHYLPGDNLVKVDRASMSVGLEIRAPLLSHRICELARAFVRTFPYASFENAPKWPLRHLVSRYVPEEIIKRPKMGFSVPLADWLRGELSGWALDTVSSASHSASELIDLGVVREELLQHADVFQDRSATIWPALAFLQWHSLQCARRSDFCRRVIL